jgi:SAM-dependent methyltransferase
VTNNDWYCHYAPRWLSGLTAEQISADRAAAMIDLDAVLARTGLCPADRILEVGCGWGRHSLALAQRGFSQVISIDIAPELLARGAALARAEGLSCRFRHQNFTQVEDGPFAAILSLYDRSVCGFPTEAEDRHSLQHLARLLVLGGWLVFGINDWPERLPMSSCIQQPTCDGVEVREVVSDPAVMVCTQRTTQLHAAD